MVEFPEIRVEFHILQEIVHPAHVPLEGKAEAAFLRCLCDARPRGGLFGDHHGAGEMSGQDAV